MECNDGNCYSCRIGRTPQGGANTVDGEYSKASDAATIIGAGKLTGHADGFSLGALTAVTAREDAETAGTNSIGHRSRAVEPRGVFAAPTHNAFLIKFSYWLNMSNPSGRPFLTGRQL